MRWAWVWASLLSLPLLFASPATARVERVWLTHRTSDPSTLVVNWATKKASDSKVRFGPTEDHGQEAHTPRQPEVLRVAVRPPAQEIECGFAELLGGVGGAVARGRRPPCPRPLLGHCLLGADPAVAYQPANRGTTRRAVDEAGACRAGRLGVRLDHPRRGPQAGARRGAVRRDLPNRRPR